MPELVEKDYAIEVDILCCQEQESVYEMVLQSTDCDKTIESFTRTDRIHKDK